MENKMTYNLIVSVVHFFDRHNEILSANFKICLS